MATTTFVPGYIDKAREFLARSKGYLEQGDLHQASEKGWGAAAHMAKAVAHANGWEYEHHGQFDGIITNARQRYRLPQLRNYGKSAHILHQNYYQHPSMLNADTIQEDIEDVENLLNALEPHVV